ncbi:MAG: Crp/Fnr family transcriptional regulator [Ahrensia sp.]|nr:Crp/Fnr family transcriptional regulator [Ahrensia sp.]
MQKRQDIHNSDIPVVCQSCEARHKGVCGALAPDQLTRLSEHTAKSAHQAGSDLSSAVDSRGQYANILSGVVKLTKMSRDGRQQIVGLQFAPDFMGRPFSEHTDVDAVASTNVRLCSFPVSVLEEMLEESPAMERRLYQQTMAELDEARDWLFALGRKSAREKVASFLLLIATHSDPAETGESCLRVELPLKRADIADFLGLTIETVSRQITNLRKAGVIEVVDRNRVDIPSLSALRNEACADND